MKVKAKQIQLKHFSLVLFLGMLAFAGCESNTGVVAPPEITAEEQALLDARQAEYSKSMQEAYGK